VERTKAKSGNAARASDLVEGLQRRFVEKLEAASQQAGHDQAFTPIEWLRDEGRHGGGVRFATVETPVFNRASVNVSSVHYDDEPNKRLSSATAISTIIHPRDPRAPSMHMHISWTELRDGTGYWRVMGDLNPSNVDEGDKQAFDAALKAASGEHWDEGRAQGERYFNIPALERTRGVSHFYLEGFSTGDFDADAAFAREMGEATIDTYIELLRKALALEGEASEEQRNNQLAYHSLYLLQVLTLDRGTTSGLLVHDQNDVGIMGSLPAFVDRALLSSWIERHTAPQDALLRGIVDTLTDESPSHVTDDVRQRLAAVVREHYQAHPDALKLQASGNVIPPTVDNHGDR
jgi:coproporphyrinogen III oxidase